MHSISLKFFVRRISMNKSEENYKQSEFGADINDISGFVLKALSCENELGSFLDRVYKEYGMPLIVTDMAFRLVAYAGPKPCADPLWQKLIDSGEAEPETVINEYFGDGFTDKMIAADGPVDVTWGVNADYPQSTCAVKIGGVAEGCCSVLYMDKSRLDFALRLNAAVTSAAVIYLGGRKQKSHEVSMHDRAAIARFLLENTETPISLIYGAEFFKKQKFEQYYMVAVITADDPDPARMQNVVTRIKTKYPDMLYLNKGEDIYLYFWNLRSDNHRARLLEDFRSETRGKISLICGVSGLFTDPEKRGIYIQQAKLAMDYGKNQGFFEDSSTYYFYDCYFDIVTRIGFGSIMPENLVLPEIYTLLEYDKENKTNFFQSLECYLDEYCDLSDAAAKLFVHRNSLLYRLNKCEDIMNVSLKDKAVRRRLSLCCSILKRLES